MDPREISIEDYQYQLPEERIAYFPKEERDSSRLLIYRESMISEDRFFNLTEHLPQGSAIVFNKTRVVAARLQFRKPTGARIEIFCLEPADSYPDVATALATTGSVLWKCMVGNASAWKGDLILHNGTVSAELVSREPDHFLIRFRWEPASSSFAEILQLQGSIPLPPYIRREAAKDDLERYQTVYANQEGSVAAPTAGLHFSDHVLQQLEAKHIEKYFLTLHVGAGTFKPVKAAKMGDHAMHAEFIEIEARFVNALRNGRHQHLIAVGTTSLRTLESLYWLGIKIIRQPDIHPSALTIGQWYPYEQDTDISAKEALEALAKWMEEKQLDTLVTKTSLLIVPGYRFRIVNILITNFHQPGSTLLLLVAAFIGKKWREVYNYALANEFRFLSYGDSCLLFQER